MVCATNDNIEYANLRRDLVRLEHLRVLTADRLMTAMPFQSGLASAASRDACPSGARIYWVPMRQGEHNRPAYTALLGTARLDMTHQPAA